MGLVLDLTLLPTSRTLRVARNARRDTQASWSRAQCVVRSQWLEARRSGISRPAAHTQTHTHTRVLSDQCLKHPGWPVSPTPLNTPKPVLYIPGWSLSSLLLLCLPVLEASRLARTLFHSLCTRTSSPVRVESPYSCVFRPVLEAPGVARIFSSFCSVTRCLKHPGWPGVGSL